MKSWLPSATRKETNSHLSNVETSARDSHSFSFFRFIQPVFPNLPLLPPPAPLSLFLCTLPLSLSLSFPLSSTSAIVRLYYPRATFSLLRIECREPAASHPTPSFWLTSANPRNAWDGKDRGWGREAGCKTGWETPIREDEGGMVGRIAEVGHHVNCIPDCGPLKSSALHPNPPHSPPCPLQSRCPKLDLTSQRPQGRFGLQQGRHLWGPPAATAGELSLVSRQTPSVKIFVPSSS